MSTTRIIFNIPENLKKAALRRAKEEDTTVSEVLRHTLALYGQGVFDPDDVLSKEDLAALAEAREDVKNNRTYTLDEVRNNLKLS